MALANMRYSGKLNENDLEFICSSEKLSVKISHPSKLYYWRGEISDESLNQMQNGFTSSDECFRSLCEVLQGHLEQLEFNPSDKVLFCNFIFLQKMLKSNLT